MTKAQAKEQTNKAMASLIHMVENARDRAEDVKRRTEAKALSEVLAKMCAFQRKWLLERKE